VTSRRLDRLTNLTLFLLQAGRPVTREEILRQVAGYTDPGVSPEAARQMFERDKKTLIAAGVPVRTAPVPGSAQVGYVIGDDDLFSPELHLSHWERVALHLARSWLASVNAGAAALAPELDAVDIAPAVEMHVTVSLADPGVLEAAVRAIRQSAGLAFKYKGKERIVRPLRYIMRGGAQYLQAYEGETLKTFRLDRVEGGVRVTDAPGPAGGSGAVARLPRLRVTKAFLLVDDAYLPLALKRWGGKLTGRSLLPGYTEVAMDIADEYFFLNWVVGFGPHVLVVSPRSLRQEVKRWIEGAATA
jgi:predicted DNA-binding transcriptional regulator YafY